ncbi:hypothetical protein EVAR_24405_1 [Eumeta japonica]|uniref:Uncharacterized protein n=1 Tax=Eumeta variegata TaxID=151549 RepID=A0A4C1VT30_EUMVA|nr:hypothetical protein EVAR_24405_1 [Eumeta japonica]
MTQMDVSSEVALRYARTAVVARDSRAVDHHYVRKVRPSRTHYELGQQNVSSVPLVDPQHALLPPLHIKLGLIKDFVKALNREGPAFQYIIKLFPKLSYAKIKVGIFVGPDIQKLMADAKFTKCLTPDEQQHGHRSEVSFTTSQKVKNTDIPRVSFPGLILSTPIMAGEDKFSYQGISGAHDSIATPKFATRHA